MYTPEGLTPCLVNDPELWFSDRNDSRRSREAKDHCHSCPEAKACLESVLAFETKAGATTAGIYAALTEHERLVLYRRRRLPVSLYKTA